MSSPTGSSASLHVAERPVVAAEPVISFEDVTVRYRVPRERILSFKDYAIRWLKRKIVYDDVWALRDVSVEVHRGEVLGIIGPNGAGKSTFLKLIARIMRPTSGRVKVDGRVAPLLELGAGFDHELTGRENVFLNGAMLGYRSADLAARFERIVEFAGLAEFIDMPLRTYSSGMVARLGFALATDVTPEILIVDELLAVGDAEFQKKSRERIESFQRHGQAILLVSHDMTLVQGMCARTAWLDHGRLRAIGPTADVVRQYEQTVR